MFLMKIEQEKKRFYSSITRLIKDPLFWIQLLVLILLSVAAAGPFYETEEPLSGEHTVFVIDSSASMQTENRFQEAISIAKGFVSKKNTLILAENVPVIAVESAGASDTEDVLDELQPKAVVADLSSAISTGMRAISQEGGRIIVISDFTSWEGDDPVAAKSLAESFGLKVTFIKVGKTADNVGFINGWIEAGEQGYVYNSVIKNYNSRSENVRIEVSTGEGEDTSKTLNLNVPAKQTKQFMLTNIGTGITILEITGEDSLPVDNVAYISVPKVTQNNVLLVADKEKLPSKTALSLIPNTKAALSQTIPSNLSNYDVVVVANKEKALSANEISRLEGFLEGGGAVVFIASDALSPEVAEFDLIKLLPIKPLEVVEQRDGVTLKVVQPTRLSEDLKFDEIAVYEYINATPRADSTTLVATKDNIPVLTYWVVGDGTVAYVGLNDELGEDAWGNFHNLPEYPVFWVKLIGWLGGAGDISDYNIKTGSITALAKIQEFEAPSGTMTGNRVLFDEAGIYEVLGKEIAVNLYNDRESDTTIDASEVIERSLEDSGADIVRATTYTARKDIDIYLIAIVFLLLLLEIMIIRKRGEL